MSTQQETCETAPGQFDHDFELVDDSFSHEFGTEVILYYRCRNCGAPLVFEDEDLE